VPPVAGSVGSADPVDPADDGTPEEVPVEGEAVAEWLDVALGDGEVLAVPAVMVAPIRVA
jgi:hypothetical protein